RSFDMTAIPRGNGNGIMRRGIFLTSVFAIALASAHGVAAQTVVCRAQRGQDAIYRGTCTQGDSNPSDIVLHSALGTSSHLWLGSATTAVGGAMELGIDAGPRGTVRLGRAWLMAKNVKETRTSISFTYDTKIVAPANSVDSAIILRARSLLSDN